MKTWIVLIAMLAAPVAFAQQAKPVAKPAAAAQGAPAGGPDAMFDAWDTNHDGKLQASEYAQMTVVQLAGKSAPPMSAFDKDKNQSLDFPEYVDALKTLAKSQPAAAATPKKQGGN